MNKKIKSSLKFILFLGIGVVLMYFAFRNVDLKQMLKDLMEASYGWVAVSLILTIAANMSRAYRWGMLIEPISKLPKLSNLFYAVSSGYLANLAVPRLGEVTRCTVLYEVEEVPFDALVGTVIAERVIDLIMLVLLIVLTIVSNIHVFGHYFADKLKHKLSFLAHLSSGLLILAGLICILGIGLGYAWRKKIMRVKLASKLIHFIIGIWDGLKSVLTLKRKGGFLVHTFFIWFMYYLSAYVCFFSIPEMAGLGFSAGLFVLVLGGLGMSAPVQGGVGVYHLLVAGGLLQVYQLDHSKGLAYATIVLSSQWLLTIVMGCISFVMLNIEKRKLLKI
jgi:uncharacterized protein (TIRG00374 family)